jgi:hypothetical protein
MSPVRSRSTPLKLKTQGCTIWVAHEPIAPSTPLAATSRLERRAREGPAMDDAMRDKLVTIEAGQVTVIGEPEVVERALAAGLYGTPSHPKAMSREEDHVMTGVYVGVGLLLAAGAGYLAWRYLLSDENKTKAKDMLADGATKARRAVRDAKGRLIA